MKCFFNETKFGENSLGEMGELKCGFLWPFFFHLNKSTLLDAIFLWMKCSASSLEQEMFRLCFKNNCSVSAYIISCIANGFQLLLSLLMRLLLLILFFADLMNASLQTKSYALHHAQRRKQWVLSSSEKPTKPVAKKPIANEYDVFLIWAEMVFALKELHPLDH